MNSKDSPLNQLDCTLRTCVDSCQNHYVSVCDTVLFDMISCVDKTRKALNVVSSDLVSVKGLEQQGVDTEDCFDLCVSVLRNLSGGDMCEEGQETEQTSKKSENV